MSLKKYTLVVSLIIFLSFLVSSVYAYNVYNFISDVQKLFSSNTTSQRGSIFNNFFRPFTQECIRWNPDTWDCEQYSNPEPTTTYEPPTTTYEPPTTSSDPCDPSKVICGLGLHCENGHCVQDSTSETCHCHSYGSCYDTTRSSCESQDGFSCGDPCTSSTSVSSTPSSEQCYCQDFNKKCLGQMPKSDCENNEYGTCFTTYSECSRNSSQTTISDWCACHTSDGCKITSKDDCKNAGGECQTSCESSTTTSSSSQSGGQPSFTENPSEVSTDTHDISVTVDDHQTQSKSVRVSYDCGWISGGGSADITGRGTVDVPVTVTDTTDGNTCSPTVTVE